MKTNVYSLFDIKAGVYSSPIFAVNDAVAIRSFSGAVNAPNTTTFNNPEDFELRRLGTFDDNTGVITGHDVEVLCNGVTVKKSAMDLMRMTPKATNGSVVSSEVNS